ncbi:MAG: prepilin-type N-terminal cleavage/methylation domain-containing protein [Candidatus Omnitrophota bacterium]
MLKLNKGFTLVELTLAVVLLGIVIGSVNVYSKYIGVMYKDVDKSAIVAMSQLGSGVEYMVQRLIHTNTNERTASTPKGLVISPDGKSVDFIVIYGGAEREARIYFQNNKVYYDYNIRDDEPAKPFLTGIIDLSFKKEATAYINKMPSEQRLAVEIEAEHEPYPIKIRTSLTGRNRPVGSSRIN